MLSPSSIILMSRILGAGGPMTQQNTGMRPVSTHAAVGTEGTVYVPVLMMAMCCLIRSKFISLLLRGAM